jgi:hypothetical protein
MSTIVIKKHEYFGNIGYKPTNEAGIKMAKLMNKKTFTESELRSLKELGFNIELQQEELAL